MKSAIALILLFCSCAYAEIVIYRSVDETGTVVFSDQHSPGAEPVIVDIVPGYAPVAPARPDAIDHSFNESADQLPSARSPDYTLTIIHPVNEESVWINDGNVEVEVLIEPVLQYQLGHTLQLTLNGLLVGSPVSTTRFVFEHLDRGSHQLMATVFDERGDALASSATIVFHLHRAAQPQQNQ